MKLFRKWSVTTYKHNIIQLLFTYRLYVMGMIFFNKLYIGKNIFTPQLSMYYVVYITVTYSITSYTRHYYCRLMQRGSYT